MFNMKTINTQTIFDNSKQPLYELYENRLGDGEYDLARPEVQRAILELKTYHLPPLYNIPSLFRNKVALRPEIALFSSSECVVHSRLECPRCNAYKPLYGHLTHMCLECWAIHLAELWKKFPIRATSIAQIRECTMYVPGHLSFFLEEPWFHTLDATTLRDLQQQARLSLRLHPRASRVSTDVWTTPKKTFLVLELGCKHCGYIPDWKSAGWFWSADFSEWTNGYCPDCKDHDRSHSTVWGMDEREYRHWQESFTATRKLHRTLERYGALSLLLVSPSPNWTNYITRIVPHATRPSQLEFKPGATLANKVGDLYKTKAKSLEDLSLKIEDMI